MNSIKEQLPYDVIPIFPLPIYKSNIEREFTKEEQDELGAIISEQSHPTSANHPVTDPEYLSENDITKNISIDRYLLKRKIFLSIHSFIQYHLKEFVTTILGIDIVKTSWVPHITQSWLNAYKSNHYDPPHNHYNHIISGVFYINCLKNLPHDKTDGILFVSNAHNMINQINVPIVRNTMFSDKPCHIPVVAGDLVLFPSSAMHSVNPNETSDQTRISLAFNIV